MLRLLLDGNEIDLYQDESVNLTLQFADIQEINNSLGSFSQTFRVPATANNVDYFGPLDRWSAVDVLNLKQRIPAELLSNTIPIIQGFCQVKAIYIQKERYADIELVFFSGSIDLKTELSGKMLRDLDLSDYDHTLNYTNVQASWSGIGIGPEIRYGLVDKGWNWNATNLPWTDTAGLWQGQLTPFIQIKRVLDAIMDDAGFTYDSDFFDSTGNGGVDKMYMPCLNGTSTVNTDAQEDQTASAGLDGNRVGVTGLAVLQLRDTIANATDPNDNWTSAGGFKYTAPYTGYYKIRFYCKWFVSATLAHHAKIYLYHNGSEVAKLVDTDLTSSPYLYQRYQRNYQFTWDQDVWNSASEFTLGDDSPLGDLYVYNQGFLLEAGDEIAIYRETAGTSTIIYGGDGNTPEVGQQHTTSIEIYEVSSPLSGQSVTMSDNMPDFSQLDFVLGLQKMFNLVFVPDKVKAKHLLIEPFTDYTSTGTAKDWTDKVDFSKDLTLAPTADLQKQEYLWTYTEGNDFISQAVQESLNRVYGRFRVTEPDNDFATGTTAVTSTFAPFITSLIPGGTQFIHRSLTKEGTIVEDPLPMVAYWHGLSTQFGQWYLRADDGTTGSALTFFPSFGNYSTDFADITDKDLMFGMESPFVPMIANPVNTLYFEYWAQYVAELYSDEARTLKCSMRLSKTELADFEFSDRIYLKDSYWRVLKMSYDANIEGLTEVELIKELSDVTVCEDVPTAWDSRRNYIRFNNSSGVAPDFGSQKCCELYGFQWVANSGAVGKVTPTHLCKPRPQIQPPQNEAQ